MDMILPAVAASGSTKTRAGTIIKRCATALVTVVHTHTHTHTHTRARAHARTHAQSVDADWLQGLTLSCAADL
jgi:kynurenine formamidase